MPEVIQIRYGRPRFRELCDCEWIEMSPGETCVVATSRGMEMGVAVSEKLVLPAGQGYLNGCRVLRRATEADFQQARANEDRSQYASELCRKKILEHRRQMNLVDVEYLLDGSKVIFYYTAEHRVDFRALVKELAYLLGARIEMRHIGVRDKARMVGGYGPCGCPLCCTLHCHDFEPVSIKMAKEQRLTLNPSKISGICDRLMCCLRYEYETYRNARHRFPRIKTVVQTPKGQGVVVDVNMISDQVFVSLDTGVRAPFPLREIRGVSDPARAGDRQKGQREGNKGGQG